MHTNSCQLDNVALQYLILHGRHPVLQEITDLVRHQMCDIQDWLCIGRRYVARELMGDAFWKLLTWDEKRLCGSVISHLVAQGEWPLIKREKRSVGEANSYMANADAEAWLLSQLGVHTTVVPSVMLTDEGSTITSSKE